MKKHLAMIPLLTILLVTSGCCRTVNRVDFVIPAGTESEVIYSNMEVSPRKDHIEVNSGENLGDTSVRLKQVDSAEDDENQGDYLTGGVTVKLGAEKGKWYKIGIVGNNPTDEDIVVSVLIDGADVRIP